jgi:hypothetical protein
MEINALKQLISEDVKFQGQISCVMVSELAPWTSESSPELLPESSPEWLPESSPEEMRCTSTTLLPGSSLEESALTSMRVDRFFLHVEEKTCLSMTGIAGVHQLGPCARVWLPPLGRQRIGLFHGVPWKTHGAACWDDSSSSSQNLTLLAGAADSTEEDGQGCGRGASSLKNLPVESQAIPTTETRLRWRRGRRKLEKGIEG